MSMSNVSYCTTDAVRKLLGLSPTTDDVLIAQKVAEASSIVRTFTGRDFHATTGAVLYYDNARPSVMGRSLLLRNDVLSIDAVINGATGTLSASDYSVYYSGAYPTEVRLKSSSGQAWSDDSSGDSDQAIRIVATTGFCTLANIPPDVSGAVIEIAAYLYQNRDNQGAQSPIAIVGGGSTPSAPAGIANILSRLTRYKTLQGAG